MWGASEADIEAAGGFGVAEGYYTMQFAGVGKDFPVLKEIRDDVQGAGQAARRRRWTSTVYYNRGVLIAALHVEAIRNAIKAKGGAKPTGEDVKKGMEKIKDFTLGGLVPPLEITPTDHEGGGWVQIWTVKGGKFVKDDRLVPGLPRRDREAPHGRQLTSTVPSPRAEMAERARIAAPTADQAHAVASTTSRSSTTASSSCSRACRSRSREGGITTLLGANGAGKTTTLKAISGVLRTERGEVTKGTIELGGKRIDGMRAARRHAARRRRRCSRAAACSST